MTKLKIIEYSSDDGWDRIKLRDTADPVTDIDDEVRQLINDMIETMVAANGAGLAAPQVGVHKRVFVAEIKGEVLSFINPKIKKRSVGENRREEGCLSFPNIFVEIPRSSMVVVEALNQEGELFKIKASGDLARLLQHEIDHLDGTLIIDWIGT